MKLRYRGIDLSDWDPRVQDIVRTYGNLEPWRYEAWLRQFKRETEYVQLSYIRHTAEKVSADSFTGKGNFQEAKRLFELLIELDISPMHHYTEIANQFLSIINSRI